METSAIIIVVVLVIFNGIMIISLILRKKDELTQLEVLKKEKKSHGINIDEIKDDDLKDEIEPKQCYSWILGIVICLDIWISGAIITHWWADSFFKDVPEGDSRKALFGDSFGAVNALVSALAFAGMIVAFILQRYELRLQRKELKDSRAEMEHQTSQFKDQNKNIEIQRFENLFYNMLNLQQKIVDGLRYDYYEVEYVTVPFNEGGYTTDKKKVKREVVGRVVFRYLFNDVSIKVEGGNVRGYRNFLCNSGLSEYDNTFIPSYFDHYFRHLYKIVQFVDSQEFSFEEKYKYLSFLRGTLSRYELVWLFYSSLVPDYSKFKILIERYSLLKSLRVELLTMTKEAKQYYDGLGLTSDNAVGDIPFYMTDDSNEKSKYLLSAFYNAKDYQDGISALEQYRELITKTAEQRKQTTAPPSSLISS